MPDAGGFFLTVVARIAAVGVMLAAAELLFLRFGSSARAVGVLFPAAAVPFVPSASGAIHTCAGHEVPILAAAGRVVRGLADEDGPACAGILDGVDLPSGQFDGLPEACAVEDPHLLPDPSRDQR